MRPARDIEPRAAVRRRRPRPGIRRAARALLCSLVLAAGALAQAPPPTEETAPEDYRIGVGDVLSIEFFGNPELDRKVRVLPDGSISLPLLGAVTVAEMTTLEAQDRIAAMLSEKGYVKEPQVTIFVEEFRSRRIYVQGAVGSPGVYEMIGSSRLLEMIAQAGGLSGRGAGPPDRTIYVIRSGEQGEQERIEIDTRRLLEEGDPSLNIPLQPGDVVMVPYAETHRVYVTGAVERPGQVEYSSADGITVLQAITAAGGPTERANLKEVFVLRRDADGGQERIRVNLKRIRRGKEDDFPLRNNDTVDVGAYFF